MINNVMQQQTAFEQPRMNSNLTSWTEIHFISSCIWSISGIDLGL